MDGWIVAGILAVLVLGAGVWRDRRLQRRRRNLERTTASLKAEVASLQDQLQEARDGNRIWSRLAEKRVEERVERHRSEYVRKLEDLDRLRLQLRGLAHDIRNPLVAVRFISEEVLEETEGESLRERVTDQVAAVDRCASLISQMVAAIASTSSEEHESTAPVQCDTHAFARFVRARLRELSGREANGSVSVSPQTPTAVSTRPPLVERVLDNLLSNAYEHAGGRNVAVHFDGNPTEIVIRVSDCGPGLPPDRLKALMTRETGATNGPRGIGLSVVVNLIEELGGQLEVFTAPSSGTSFWVRLPMRPPDEPRRDRSPVTSMVRVRPRPDGSLWTSPAS